MKPLFFSIIIPAHNEESYIAVTLQSLKDINYPRDRFEILVVENGSSDKTFEIASGFKIENLKVYVSDKGASKAKNFGLAKASDQSDWSILLDADTLLGTNFLTNLDGFLREKDSSGQLSVGTTEVVPYGDKRLKADLWFSFYNLGHRLTKTSFAIQIMKSSLRSKVVFDETIKFAEDLKFIKDLLKIGDFFYFPTKEVITSTRRFDETGWFMLFLKWNWQALFLAKTKKKTTEYTVIR